MKYIKKYENNSKLNKCRELFDELFGSRLFLYRTNAVGYEDYNLFTKITKGFNKDTLEDFEFLFNFLKSNNLKFAFTSSPLLGKSEGGFRLDIYFDDIDNFMDSLETLKNLNKYNL